MSAGPARRAAQYLRRCCVAETFARPVVESSSDLIALTLGKRSHRHPFRQVLADQAIRILVGAALPRVVGRGEVEPHTGLALDLEVAVKLGSVVGGQCFEDETQFAPGAAKQLKHSIVQSAGGYVEQFADERVSTDPLNERGHRIAPAPVHRIDFPVSDRPPLFHGGRPLADVPLPCKPAPALLRGVALPMLLCPLPQTQMQRTAGMLLTPDVLVDRLVADTQTALAPKPSADLLGAPSLRQQVLDKHPLQGGEGASSSAPRAATVRALLRFTRTVSAVMHRGIPLQLAANGTGVSTHAPSDLGIRQRRMLRSQRGQSISLVGGDLVISQ